MSNLVINFSGEKTLLTIPQREVKSDKVTILKFEDDPNEKVVTAFIKESPGKIVLWKGADYDAVGDWTTQNVIDKINSLYNL